jgi:hypothetical protein
VAAEGEAVAHEQIFTFDDPTSQISDF